MLKTVYTETHLTLIIGHSGSNIQLDKSSLIWLDRQLDIVWIPAWGVATPVTVLVILKFSCQLKYNKFKLMSNY